MLYREAATARSACRASYAASRVGQQSAKGATQIIVMIVTCRKSNKNLPLLQQMPKLLSSDRMQSAEHGVVGPLEIFLANVEISWQMFFGSSRLWVFVLYTSSFKLPHKERSHCVK